MNKKILSFGSIAALTLASMPVYAQITVPNTFTSGEAAVAADVNANFNTLATAINDNTTAVDANTTAIAALPGGGCPTNAGEMVQIGKLCVDKYEASVFDNAAGEGFQYGLIANITENVDDYLCDDDGNNCSGSDALSNIYAHSKAGVEPSTSITWFQATQACANVGKRLLTNAEWQMVAAGTPDPGAEDDDTTSCATKEPTTGTVVVLTGSRSACVSNWGVNDMVGNVNEWVADWIQGNSNDTALNNSTASSAFGDDAMVNVNAPDTATSAFPAAIYRGGRAGASGNAGTGPGVFAFYANSSPAGFDDQLGFRCAQ